LKGLLRLTATTDTEKRRVNGLYGDFHIEILQDHFGFSFSKIGTFIVAGLYG
jgi:hypothetical protein